MAMPSSSSWGVTGTTWFARTVGGNSSSAVAFSTFHIIRYGATNRERQGVEHAGDPTFPIGGNPRASQLPDYRRGWAFPGASAGTPGLFPRLREGGWRQPAGRPDPRGR